MRKLLMILPLALILCFMFGCQDKEAMAELKEFKAQAALEKQNKALIMRYMEAWEKGDIEALKEILSPVYVGHIPGKDSSLEEVLERLKSQDAMCSDRTSSLEEIIVKGNKVILRYLFMCTHEGDVEGFPATGNKVEVKCIGIYQVESGKIVESWGVYDSLGFIQQLGMELKPKEEEK